MNYCIKPITEPNGSQTFYWLLFPEGHIETPTAVFTDYEMADFVEKYCEEHSLKLILNNK
jgi:hypothetical protein